MKTSGYLLGLFLLSLVAQPALAAGKLAYKCTNDAGEVSFLDKRPTEGCVTIETVNITDTGTAAAAEPADDLAAQDQKDMAEREARAQEECQKRKSELDILRTRSKIIINDPATGEKRAMTQEEHQDKLRKYEEYVKILCEGKTPAP